MYPWLAETYDVDINTDWISVGVKTLWNNVLKTDNC